jgi:hypothetical protein
MHRIGRRKRGTFAPADAGHDDADTRRRATQHEHNAYKGGGHRLPSTCDQMAIMPTNRASERSKGGGFMQNGFDHDFSPRNGERT